MLLHTSSGGVVAGTHWIAPASAVDDRLLSGITGPVLDVGCGPGRILRALLEQGVPALGIDLTPELVVEARARGVDVLERCVFGPVPAPGHWRTVLLLDGNIGIGGDPVALLRRVAELLAHNGRILVETAAPGTPKSTEMAHVEMSGRCGPRFAWQTVSAGRLPAVAASAGLEVERAWRDEDRWFASVIATGA